MGCHASFHSASCFAHKFDTPLDRPMGPQAHKSADVARRQLELLGAKGVCCQKVGYPHAGVRVQRQGGVLGMGRALPERGAPYPCTARWGVGTGQHFSMIHG